MKYDDDKNFMGQIGYNVPMNREEREEDLLELMYEWWKKGRVLSTVDLAVELGITKRELNTYVKRMVTHGYLEEPTPGMELKLTDFGKIQGLECISRHQNLTQFLQMVSGMELEEAQENACRLEHVINKKAVQGITDFIKYGDVYDRILTNNDLRFMYEDGVYETCMGIYYVEKRHPRILAPEHDWFEDESVLVIKEGKSKFLLNLIAEKAETAETVIWYHSNGTWIKAMRSEKGFQLPADIFTFTVSAAVPVVEGVIMIALTKGENEPAVTDCRELNVHMWQ